MNYSLVEFFFKGYWKINSWIHASFVIRNSQITLTWLIHNIYLWFWSVVRYHPEHSKRSLKWYHPLNIPSVLRNDTTLNVPGGLWKMKKHCVWVQIPHLPIHFLSRNVRDRPEMMSKFEGRKGLENICEHQSLKMSKF